MRNLAVEELRKPKGSVTEKCFGICLLCTASDKRFWCAEIDRQRCVLCKNKSFCEATCSHFTRSWISCLQQKPKFILFLPLNTTSGLNCQYLHGNSTIRYSKFRSFETVFWLLWGQDTRGTCPCIQAKCSCSSKILSKHKEHVWRMWHLQSNDSEGSGSTNARITAIRGNGMIPFAKFPNSRCGWRSPQQHVLDVYKNLHCRPISKQCENKKSQACWPTFNPRTYEPESGGTPSWRPAWSTSLHRGQSGLPRENVSSKSKTKPNKKYKNSRAAKWFSIE